MKSINCILSLAILFASLPALAGTPGWIAGLNVTKITTDSNVIEIQGEYRSALIKDDRFSNSSTTIRLTKEQNHLLPLFLTGKNLYLVVIDTDSNDENYVKKIEASLK